MVRIILAEGPADALETITVACNTACEGRAWTVLLPGRRPRAILLCPADASPDPAEVLLDSLMPAVPPGAVIGASGVVALSDTAAGYEQARHALAIARRDPQRIAWFSVPADLAAALGPAAIAWARRALARLTAYEPSRAQGPGAAELHATLQAWLAFGASAARELKIHRNTLAGRLRKIEAILGCDLSQLPVQAELHLALRLMHRPGATGGPAPAGCLTPAARAWASMTLAPLAGDAILMDTVRAWLDADASAEAAAEALAVSPRGIRRRLARAGQRIGRSLTRDPAARYDVLLAIRIQEAPAARLRSIPELRALDGVQSGPVPRGDSVRTVQENREGR